MKKIKTAVINYLLLMLGASLLACGITVFFEPAQIVNGGVSGLGIIIADLSANYLGYEIPVSVSNLIFNVPLLLCSYFVFGKVMVGKTVFATFYLSLALEYTKILPVFTGDYLLAAIYGGILSGSGVALVMRGYATTGGTELAAMLLNKLLGHISVARLLFLLDAAIILLGCLVFGVERTMYAIISVYVSTKVIDNILEGMHFSKALFIISQKAEDIANQIMFEIDRGVTSLTGKGMYTGNEAHVLLSVVSQKEIVKVKKIAKTTDPDAFIIVADVREVLGEGFKTEG